MARINSKYNRALARTAAEAKKYAVLKKLLVTLLISLITLSSVVYIIALLYTKYGSFTVSVDKRDMNKYSLTLDEERAFEKRRSRLNAKMAVDITNISGNDLPGNIDSINGSHNGENYLAYTFYLKNIGTDTVTCEYYLYITNVTNNVDEAIRIRIYRDGKDITYAKTRSDSDSRAESDKAEPGTTRFITNRSVCRPHIENFKPQDVTKFTVVMWVEGNDPDCVDELIGGSLKCDMKISVVESKDAELA